MWNVFHRESSPEKHQYKSGAGSAVKSATRSLGFKMENIGQGQLTQRNQPPSMLGEPPSQILFGMKLRYGQPNVGEISNEFRGKHRSRKVRPDYFDREIEKRATPYLKSSKLLVLAIR